MTQCECQCNNSWTVIPLLLMIPILLIAVNSHKEPISAEEQLAKDQAWKNTSESLGNFINGEGKLLGGGILALLGYVAYSKRKYGMMVCIILLGISGYMYLNGFTTFPQLGIAQPIPQTTDWHYGTIVDQVVNNGVEG